MASPGGLPVRAVNAATSGATSARIWLATATPSSSRAGMRATSLGLGPWPRRLSFKTLQRVGAPEHDQPVATADGALRLGIELHASVLMLDADHDHAEPLTQVGV